MRRFAPHPRVFTARALACLAALVAAVPDARAAEPTNEPPPPLSNFASRRAAAPLAAGDAWACGAPAKGAVLAPLAERFDPGLLDKEAPWAAKLDIVETAPGGETAISSCSAVVVDRAWLVTAAHCVGVDPWREVRATLGASDSGEREALRRRADAAFCHSGFDPNSLAYDVALLRLDRPLPPDFPSLRLARPAEAAALAQGDHVRAAGWRRSSNRDASAIIRRAAMRVVTPSREKDAMIVAAPNDEKASLCVGESGAPLIGDTGYGEALFGVFSSVDVYLDPNSGALVELCQGFEARSYFTPVGPIYGWLESAMQRCVGAGACGEE